MNKAAKTVLVADAYIMHKAFVPIAWKIDERWHVNPWRIAIYIFTASAFLMIVSLGMSGMPVTLQIILGAVLMLVRAADIRRLSRISERWERAVARGNFDGALSIDMVRYWQPWNRVYYLLCSLIFFLPVDIGALIASLQIHHGWFPHAKDIALFVSGQWFALCTPAYYFAGVLPPLNKRKEKKKSPAWSPAGEAAMAAIGGMGKR